VRILVFVAILGLLLCAAIVVVVAVARRK